MRPLMMDATVLNHQGSYPGTLMNDAAELVARARRGDEAAFRLIFEQHHRFILGFIYAMVGVYELAEELTQETFLRAYADLRKLRDDAKLAAWLCGIARNLTLHELRARRKRGTAVALDDERAVKLSAAQADGPDDQLLDQELHGAIREALRQLAEDRRIVFTLKILQQRSYVEIAAITGHSIPKLKTDLHRARAELRSLLEAYLEVRDEV